jgi:hypothetical protein
LSRRFVAWCTSRAASGNRLIFEQRATLADIEARPGLAAFAQDGRTARLGDALQESGGAGLDLGPGDKEIQHGHIAFAGGLAAGALGGHIGRVISA